jgi:hypothetical protein
VKQKLVKSREGGGGRFPEQRQVPLVSGRPAFLATDGADVAIITVPTRSLYAECDATLIELHLIECETASVRCSRSKLTKQTLPIDTRDMPGATVAIDSKFVYASLGRFVQVYSRRNLELLSEVYVGFHDRYTTRFLHSFGVGKLLVATASHAVVLDFTPEFDTQSRKGLVVSPNGQLVQVDYQETQWHLVAQKQLGALEILTRAVTAKGRGTDVRCAACFWYICFGLYWFLTNLQTCFCDMGVLGIYLHIKLSKMRTRCTIQRSISQTYV